MIKYLGSKRQLIPHILQTAKEAAPEATHLLDLFSGTSRVGHAFKQAGLRVSANDHNVYAYWLAKCYIEADHETISAEAQIWIDKLNKIKPEAGYFTETFCLKSRFFHPKNGAKVDSIRDFLSQQDLPETLFAVLLISLMEAADRVDSTCGIQMSYLKSWAKRAEGDLNLRLPNILPQSKYGLGKAHCLEAHEAAKKLSADIIYVDPPYNQHNYRRNYHIWETLSKWDKPESYGVANKRIDLKEHKNSFNSKIQFVPALTELIKTLQAKTLIISFNNEGFIKQEELEKLLKTRGKVSVQSIDYKRYVGAQIGQYNPKGERVGKITHLRNKELLYTVHVEN